MRYIYDLLLKFIEEKNFRFCISSEIKAGVESHISFCRSVIPITNNNGELSPDRLITTYTGRIEILK